MEIRKFRADTREPISLALEVRRAVVECTGLPDIYVTIHHSETHGTHRYSIVNDRGPDDVRYAYVSFSGESGTRATVCDTLGEDYERVVDFVARICERNGKPKPPEASPVSPAPADKWQDYLITGSD